MPDLFRLDASIRTQGSVSRAVADAFETAAAGAFANTVRRDIGLDPLPATAWRDAVTSAYAPVETHTPAQADAHRLVATLADELLAADTYLLAIPLYNFGVAQHAKAWIDLVLMDPRFGPAAPPPLAGRTAYLVTSRGGGYGPGTPRHGWDHSTPYLQRILVDKSGLDLHPIEIELTLADVTPVMEPLRPMAADNLRRALSEATRLGTAIATAPVTAAA